MKKLSLLLFAAMLLLFACQKDTTPTADNPTDPKLAAIEARLAKALAEADALLAEKDDAADDRANVTLPAGSNNGLAAAIAAAGPGGKVTVASGNHYESGTVEITFPVKIVGQSGAVFHWSGLNAPIVAPTVQLDPALHVRADDVTIKDLEIDPGANGAVNAILLEDAHNAKIQNNTMHHFQFAIVFADADNAKISNNDMTGAGIGFPGFTWPLVIMGGNNTLIADNTVSDATAALFPCDHSGEAVRNTLSNSVAGILLCTADWIVLPDGTPLPRPQSANDWMVSKNESSGNLWGYLVIDGAFNNVLFKNEASNNALYDIELCGETSRFGWPMPTSSNSTVISNGNLNHIIIKDCAPGSVIIGGTLVDTNADPCF